MKYLTILLLFLMLGCAQDVITVTEYVEVEPQEVRYEKVIDRADFMQPDDSHYLIPVEGYTRNTRLVTSYIQTVSHGKRNLGFAPNYRGDDGVYYIWFGHGGCYTYVGATLVVIWTNQDPL